MTLNGRNSTTQPPGESSRTMRNISGTLRRSLHSLIPSVVTVDPPSYQPIQREPVQPNYGTMHQAGLTVPIRTEAQSAQHAQQLANSFPRAAHERLPSYKSISEETTVYLNQRGDIIGIGRSSTGGQRRNMLYPPVARTQASSEVHDVSATVDAHGNVIIRTAPRCVASHHVYVDDYTCAGILCAILFFPLGIICCHTCCRRSVCFYCGHEHE